MNHKSICLSVILLSWFVQTTFILGQVSSEDDITKQRYKAVLAVIRSGQLEPAAKLLESSLEQNPHDHRLMLLRRSLAARYVQAGMRDLADEQLEKIIQYAIENSEHSKPLLKNMAQIMVSISYVQQGAEPRASRILDPALKLMQQSAIKFPSNVAISSGVSSLVNFKARSLVRTQPQAAIQLYQRELQRLRERRDQKLGDPNAWFVLAYNLRSAADTVGDGVADSITLPWRWEHTNILSYAVDAFPDSVDIIDAFFADQLRLIGGYEALDLEIANHLFAQTSNKFKAVFSKSNVKKSLLPLRIRIEKRAQEFRRTTAQRKLPGKKVGDLGVIHWVQDRNQQPGSPITIYYFDDWQGKASYGDLKDISNFVSSAGNELRYQLKSILPDTGQTFTWLVSMPKKIDVTPEQREKFVENFKQKFITANQFEFSIGLVASADKIAEQFGITELPVVAIISNDGIVEKVFSGKGLAESVVTELSK